MHETLLELIDSTFAAAEREEVISALDSITLDHVMARCETNLYNTRHAVLQLSHGNLKDLKYYVDRARQDFRDVIYWAGEEQQS